MDAFITDDRLQSASLTTTRAVEVHRTQVCALTRRVHEKSLFGDIPFSDVKLDRAFDKTLKAPERHLGLVVAFGPRVLGCCYCSIGGYFIGDGARIVSVHTICVDPDVSDGLLGGKVVLRLAKGIWEVSFSRFFAGGIGPEGAPHGCKLAHIS
ncbi:MULTISPECIES: hypothetical protein [Roseobacteraceae]|uniref:hypothetical protein n=1 Tax=Roseobacteraceae TaxID=2854170 RepID=UPI0032973C64